MCVSVCLSLTLSVPTLRLMKVLLSSTLRINIIIVIILAFIGFKLVDYGGKFLFWKLWHKNATVYANDYSLTVTMFCNNPWHSLPMTELLK